MSLASSQKATDILNARASFARWPKPARLDEQIKSSVVRHNRLLDQAFDLFCTLRYNGETVNAEEFCARYPAIQHSLARLLAAHRYLEDHPELVDVDRLENCPVPGDIFVGFRLERELGRGAFARVFQATELALGERQVALKISPQGTGTAEAATLGRMVHPNIVPIFSVAEDEESGLTAVCMPYLGQATLLNILDHVYGQPAPEPTAASLLEAIEEIPGAQPVIPSGILAGGSYVDGVRWLAIQLAEALAFIHAKGICHRDLKPSNILMRADGTPMLLDFNLAEDMQAPCNRQGGTPSYMSPEHLRSLNGIQAADPDRPGTRSDLYSLGVILYELLTGTHPFGPLPLNTSGTKMMPLLLERQQRGFRPIRECCPEVDV
ncbi:MAG TPA: serine/threonine-protein kinase, partial [Gemmataceae bacterium]|nr:serine/threonine-protein kinase [Gemmataceae bacterium]